MKLLNRFCLVLLFVAGGMGAIAEEAPPIPEAWIDELENRVDEMTPHLEELQEELHHQVERLMDEWAEQWEHLQDEFHPEREEVHGELEQDFKPVKLTFVAGEDAYSLMVATPEFHANSHLGENSNSEDRHEFVTTHFECDGMVLPHEEGKFLVRYTLEYNREEESHGDEGRQEHVVDSGHLRGSVILERGSEVIIFDTPSLSITLALE